MASKAETRLAIIALARELGEEPPANLEQIDKLDQLVPILEALQARKPGGPPPPPAPDPNVAPSADAPPAAVGATNTDGAGAPPPPLTPPAAPTERKVVATTYAVKEGKSVTTKRGEIGALQPVWPQDFRGAQADLDHWVANGYVEKTEHFG
jgi:hypothetical protein